MLVLSRKVEEWIIIGDDPKTAVAIQLVDIAGDKARIGIVADKSVNVRRLEVYDRESSHGMGKKLIDSIDSTRIKS